ncbi:MAG: 4Fe-4S dicluster domain-containing protein [Desulforhopalus sp.]|nr:4Fe-4S dicluster domain-containing protein [Desulforhopalus sp.]
MRLSNQGMKRVQTDVRNHTEVNYNCCFQCKTCANACPFLEAMDIHPNVILRLLQLGMDQPALESSTIWVCVGCNTCCDGCPMAIDIPSVMDALRQLALEKKVVIKEPDILNFHRQVIDSIKKYGRTHKLEIMMRYKLKKKAYLQDIGLGVTMLKKRKLDLMPQKVKDIKAIENIFKK